MSRPGNYFDNAPAESFLHTLKVEEVYGQTYEIRLKAKNSIFEYKARKIKFLYKIKQLSYRLLTYPHFSINFSRQDVYILIIMECEKMKKNIIILLFLILASCISSSTIPGNINESISNYDGTKEVSIEPAWLYDSSIKLGLVKNTKMEKNDIVLTAVVKGTHLISSGESLHIRIDKKFFNFSSIDSMTDIKTTKGAYGSGIYIPPSNWSSKRYIITKAFLKKLINANDAWVKIELSKTYVEGRFSSNALTTAKPAFIKFYNKINKWN